MDVLEPTLQMWLTFAIISVGIISYILDKFPMEITSLGIISSVLILFHFMPVVNLDGEIILTTKILLSGFADPALISILAL